MDPLGEGSPSGDQVFRLMTAHLWPEVVVAAIELGLGTCLAGRPAPAAEIAATTGCIPSAIETILEALGHLGFVEGSGEGFRLTTAGQNLLDPKGPLTPALPLLAAGPPEKPSKLVRVAREGRSIWSRDQSLDLWISYAAWSLPKALKWGEEAANLLGPLSPGARILDAGAGSGGAGFAFALAWPGAKLTCADRPEVLKVARRNAERLGLASPVTYLPADLDSRPDFGDEAFDAVILGEMLHTRNDEQAAVLLEAVKESLAPGGRLIIGQVLPPERGPLPKDMVALKLLVLLREGTCELRGMTRLANLLASAGLKVSGGSPAGPSTVIAELS